MRRDEIIEMMKKSPYHVVKSETIREKWLAGTCFILAFVLLAMC
jgi:hypothetical protein